MPRSEQQKTPLITALPLIAHDRTNNDEYPDEKPSRRPKYTTGWRFGVAACCCSAVAVFVTNLTIFLWAESKNGFAGFNDDGKHTLYHGSCETTRKLNIGVHLLINVLSTILLSASNYCMQCMSAPTRQEVDRAHAEKKWLDIGVQSLRNLRKIDRKRAMLYLLLGFSSLPLHLL